MAAGKIQGGCQPVSPGTAESSLKKSNQTLSFGPSRIPGLSLGIYGEQFARLMACQGFWGPLFPCGVVQSGEGGLQDRRASSVPSRDPSVMATGGEGGSVSWLGVSMGWTPELTQHGAATRG